jgi:hypothetical protein
MVQTHVPGMIGPLLSRIEQTWRKVQQRRNRMRRTSHFKNGMLLFDIPRFLNGL